MAKTKPPTRLLGKPAPPTGPLPEYVAAAISGLLAHHSTNPYNPDTWIETVQVAFTIATLATAFDHSKRTGP